VKRPAVNFIVDSIAFLAFLLLTLTGWVLKYAPRGRGGPAAGPGRDWLGVPHHAWGDIHFVVSIIFIVLIVVHVVLHWGWITRCARSILTRSPCPPVEGEGQTQNR
jgi:hypothetical protein